MARFLIDLVVTIAVILAITGMYIGKSHASEEIKIIGCINTNTLETTKPSNWNCFKGKGWQNIMLPPKSHINKWKQVFTNEKEIINRLAIVNGESWFNENASNKWAKWYVQTLRSYKIKPDIVSQLKWMKKRQESQKKGNCSQHKTEDRLMICLFARHYGALSPNHWYPKKNMKVREYYINYFKTNSL